MFQTELSIPVGEVQAGHYDVHRYYITTAADRMRGQPAADSFAKPLKRPDLSTSMFSASLMMLNSASESPNIAAHLRFRARSEPSLYCTCVHATPAASSFSASDTAVLPEGSHVQVHLAMSAAA
jgi:hypothetical protein